MKELELESINRLIDFYELLIEKGPNNHKVRSLARELYDLMPSETLVSEDIINYFGKIFPLAYPNSGSGLQPLSKDEAKKILEELHKREKEIKQ